MILTEKILIKINNKNKKYYNDLGYNVNTEFLEIETNHIMQGSQYKIDVSCDICGKENNISAQKYFKNKNKYNIYTCLKCSHIKNDKTNTEKYGSPNPKTVDIDPIKWKERKDKEEKIKEDIQEHVISIGAKFCIRCLELKKLDRFSKREKCIDGYINVCKDCNNTRKKNNYEKNKETLQPKYREQKRNYSSKNRDKINKRQMEYYYSVFKERNKINYIWRGLLASCLKRMNTKKSGRTIEMLGYSAQELKEHIENQFTTGMTWDNHGEWHIDHIKCVSSFSIDTPASVVNALNNLRPMWSTSRTIEGFDYFGNLNKSKYERKK